MKKRNSKQRGRRISIVVLSILVILGGVVQPTAAHEALYRGMLTAEELLSDVTGAHDHDHDHEEDASSGLFTVSHGDHEHLAYVDEDGEIVYLEEHDHGDHDHAHGETCTHDGCTDCSCEEEVCDHVTCPDCIHDHDEDILALASNGSAADAARQSVSSSSLVMEARAEECEHEWVKVNGRVDPNDNTVCHADKKCVKCGKIDDSISMTIKVNGTGQHKGCVTCPECGLTPSPGQESHVHTQSYISVCRTYGGKAENGSYPCAGAREDGHYVEGAGTYTYCNDCGKIVSGSDQREAHTWDAGVVTIAATETAEGVRTVTCIKCGWEKKETIPKQTHTHTWNTGIVTTPATCAKTGVMTYTCTTCGQTKTETIPKTNDHKWNTGVETTPATCAKTDVMTYTCTVCGETKTETIPKTNDHKWDAGKVTTEPTTTKTGVKTYTCTVCGTTKTETIPKKSGTCKTHKWNEGVVTQAATCAAIGIKTYTCTVCGETKTGSVPKMAHTWDNGRVTKEPACAPGERTYTCTVCGETKTEAIAKITVNHTWDDGVVTREANCITTGLKTYTCTVCGETYLYSYRYPKSSGGSGGGHDYTETVLKEANCNEAGRAKYVCGICGDTYEATIPKLAAHTWGAGVVTMQATCGQAGEKTYTCTVCGRKKIETIPKLTTHSYDGGRVTTQPTETSEGVMWYTCTVCGHGYGNWIPKLEVSAATCKHTTTQWTIRTAASASATGTLEEVCTKCGAKTGKTKLYGIYKVSLAGGRTATVTGYLESAGSTQTEVLNATNSYRRQSGASALSNGSALQQYANLRAIEAAYLFSHTRPNGSDWHTVNSSLVWAENLYKSGPAGTPQSVCTGWYNSAGHKANMLNSGFRTLAVGVFHIYSVSGTGVTETGITWVQLFGY